MELEKHPSYGYATPEEISLLKNADGGSDNFTKQKLMEQIKSRGGQVKKKRVLTRPLFVSEKK